MKLITVRFLILSIICGATIAFGQTTQIAVWGNNGYGEAWVPPNLPGIKSVVIKNNSALALLENGRLASWGSQTNVPPSATNIIAIAKSGSHTVVLRTNGTAFGFSPNLPPPYDFQVTNLSFYSDIRQIAAGFGFNVILQGGQARQLPTTTVNTYLISQPSVLLSLSDIRQISAGDDVAVALRSNGTFVVWGNPACTNYPSGLSDIKAIATGDDHVVALRSNGTVVAWGMNNWHQTNVPSGLSNVVSVAAGTFHSLALRSDGSLVAWGDGWSSEATVPQGLSNIAGISAVGLNSMAFVNDGPIRISKQPKGQTVFPAGSVRLGVTATGTSPLLFQWQRDGLNIESETNSTLLLTNISAAGTGAYTVLISNSATNVVSDAAQITLGNLVCWGSDGNEQIQPPPGISNISEVSGGNGFSLALFADGTVTNWGASKFGAADEKSNVVAIASGPQHVLFLDADGTVSSWGVNLYGETSVPINLTNAIAVAAGDFFSIAVKEDGTIVEWGVNIPGSAVLPTISNVTAIVCGSQHAIALKANGKIVAWGYNGSGQTNVPGNLSNVVAIAAGANSGFALQADGTLKGWGSGITIPAGVSNIVAISANAFANALALRSDGMVIAFGSDNGVGQNNVPAGVSNVVRIASGWRHNMALAGDGTPAFPTPITRRLVQAGETLELPALAAGVQPMTYQWQFNGENISGQTNSILSISDVPLSAAGEYRVIASNAVGVNTNSSTQVAIVRAPIRLLTSPDFLYSENGTVNLRATGLAQSGPVVLLGSTNLVSWMPVATNPPIAGATDFRIPATNGFSFYKVFEQE